MFEDFNLLRAAALAGQGVAICPLAIIRDDLDAGRLVALSKTEIRRGFAYYLVRRQTADSRASSARAAFCDWLLPRRRLAGPPDWLEAAVQAVVKTLTSLEGCPSLTETTGFMPSARDRSVIP